MKKLAAILGEGFEKTIFVCEVEVNQENKLSEKYRDKSLFDITNATAYSGLLKFDREEFPWDKFIGDRECDGIVSFTMSGIGCEGEVYLLEKERNEDIIKLYMIDIDKICISNYKGDKKGELLLKAIRTKEKQLINSRMVETEDGSRRAVINLYIYPNGKIDEVLNFEK